MRPGTLRPPPAPVSRRRRHRRRSPPRPRAPVSSSAARIAFLRRIGEGTLTLHLRPVRHEPTARTPSRIRLGAAARSPASWLQLLKFGLVGGSGYLINLAVFAVLTGNLGIHHAVAAVGAFCVAVTNNFLSTATGPSAPARGTPASRRRASSPSASPRLLINLVVLEALVSATVDRRLAAQAIAVAVAMPFNFLGNKLWTFA